MNIALRCFRRRCAHLTGDCRCGAVAATATVSLAAAWLFLDAAGALAQGEPVYEAPAVLVTASRLPTTFSDLTRSVTVISRQEIEAAPVHSVPELLRYAIGVEVRERGPTGVQADVSMRGSTFEQVLVLVDGVRVSDPQTGHHQMDLAILLDDVERIEVLRGHGSRLFGPNAFGGVINIITRSQRANGLVARAAYGQHQFAEVGVTGSYQAGQTTHRISAERRQSDGYRHDTDFGVNTLSYGFLLRPPAGRVYLSAGYADRRFGANSFYAGNPDEWEHTRTHSLAAQADTRIGPFSLASALAWRRHTDRYLLDRTNPALYENNHRTDTYSAELQASWVSFLGSTAVGFEAGQEEITSTRLADHSRTRGGLSAEHRIEASRRLVLCVGASAYRYTGVGWRFWPGIDAGVRITDVLRVYGSVGRAFRVPTYTELYYADPRNRGNPDLEPERAWSYEGGLAWMGSMVSADAALFRRDGRDLIDYVRNADTLAWEARNIAQVTTRGVEVNVSARPAALGADWPLRRVRVGYAFLSSDKVVPAFAQSKYLLAHPRHRLVAEVVHALPFRGAQSWSVRYEQRPGGVRVLVVDVRAGWPIGRFEPFVEVTNLFGASYEDQPSVPMPGTWVRLGITARLGEARAQPQSHESR